MLVLKREEAARARVCVRMRARVRACVFKLLCVSLSVISQVHVCVYKGVVLCALCLLTAYNRL